MSQNSQPSLNGFLIPASPCRKAIDKQGQQAVASGRTVEATIYCILKERGYTVHRHHKIDALSIHGGEIIVDFFVEGIKQFADGLVIESKWQEVPGSADEKLVYLTENIRLRYTHPAIIVCDGGGAREGIINHIKSQVDGQRLIAVYSFQEFMTWVIRNL